MKSEEGEERSSSRPSPQWVDRAAWVIAFVVMLVLVGAVIAVLGVLAWAVIAGILWVIS